MSDPCVLAAPVAERWEGFLPAPYLDPLAIPTIGLGTTHYENGLHVALSDPPITHDRAVELMMWEMRTKCVPAIRRGCPNLYAWGDNSVAAIIDFIYNLGATKFLGSTLCLRIREDDLDEAKIEIMKWVHGGGRVLTGLVKRRFDECRMLGT